LEDVERWRTRGIAAIRSYHHHILIMKSFITISLATFTAAQAATVIENYNNSTGPSDPAWNYAARVTLAENDSWSSLMAVGAWSHVNLTDGADPNKGWGHAATWYLVEIGQASTLQITMVFDLAATEAIEPLYAAQAAFSVNPGFTIYAGETIIDNPGGAHSYSNNGIGVATLNSWDQNGPGGTPGLVYQANGYQPDSTTLVEQVVLGPGLYTIAIGNGGEPGTTSLDKAYNLTFATVPEPSAATLGFLGGMLLLRRRR
jgi:hypothetical protein